MGAAAGRFLGSLSGSLGCTAYRQFHNVRAWTDRGAPERRCEPSHRRRPAGQVPVLAWASAGQAAGETGQERVAPGRSTRSVCEANGIPHAAREA